MQNAKGKTGMSFPRRREAGGFDHKEERKEEV